MSIIRGSTRRAVNAADGHQKRNSEETMDDFQRETMKSLWHAFDMLDTSNIGTVHVSQLKVITSSIGSKMGFDKAENILNKDGVTSMDFNTYFDIVKTELIAKQECPDNTDELFLGSRINAIVKTCWTFCNFERKHHCKSCTSEHCIILWRLYNFLSETDNNGEPAIPVHLDPEEAAILLKGFIDITGQRKKESEIKQFLTDHHDVPLTFTEFLNVFEKDYVSGLSNRNITQGLNHLYETYILNVLMKDKIKKRGFKVKTWKDRWMVLTPTQLKYFVGPDEKVLKGTIHFDSECSIEVPPDRPAHKANRFVINTPKKPYEMSAHDLKSKNEWVSAIELALSRVGKDPNIQKDAARERCKARAEKRRHIAEEERKRKEEAERFKSKESELDEEKRRRLEDEELLRARLNELEEERRKREMAESKWQEEQALREAEQQRLRELEEIKRELERLLAEERQAKKDEEIVRNLQSKLLEEEFEKREELERLKKQQEELLQAEREQKAVLESDREEQERLLAEAQARLEQLERDKAAAADKMQEAAEKLQKAEKDRHIMEEKVKLWKTPVGLARPIQPRADPLVTHRGLGAFCDKDFVRKPSDRNGNEDSESNSFDKLESDQGSSKIKDDNENKDNVIVESKEEKNEKKDHDENADLENENESDKKSEENQQDKQEPEEESIKDCNETENDNNLGNKSKFDSETVTNDGLDTMNPESEFREVSPTQTDEVVKELSDFNDKDEIVSENNQGKSGVCTENINSYAEDIDHEKVENLQCDENVEDSDKAAEKNSSSEQNGINRPENEPLASDE